MKKETLEKYMSIVTVATWVCMYHNPKIKTQIEIKS